MPDRSNSFSAFRCFYYIAHYYFWYLWSETNIYLFWHLISMKPEFKNNSIYIEIHNILIVNNIQIENMLPWVGLRSGMQYFVTLIVPSRLTSTWRWICFHVSHSNSPHTQIPALFTSPYNPEKENIGMLITWKLDFICH